MSLNWVSFTVHDGVLWCDRTFFFTVLHWALLCFTGLYCASLCSAVLHWASLCFTVLHCDSLCFTVLHSATLCFNGLISMTLTPCHDCCWFKEGGGPPTGHKCPRAVCWIKIHFSWMEDEILKFVKAQHGNWLKYSTESSSLEMKEKETTRRDGRRKKMKWKVGLLSRLLQRWHFFEAVKKLTKGTEGCAVYQYSSCYLVLPPIILISSNVSEISSIMLVFHHKMVSISVLYIIIWI
jgi:hypothetical protein